MNGERYDVAILGGGPGGYVAAIRAGQLGLKTALIEKAKVGGTCLHVGCIPTKALLESAEVLLLARRAGEFGVRVSEASLDLKAAMERIEVTDPAGTKSEISAGAIVLATGSRVGSLPVAPVDGRVVLSSDDILSLDHVPESLLVIGAGAVGVEFASIYHSFGSKVVLVEKEPRLVPIEDQEISDALARSFTR